MNIQTEFEQLKALAATEEGWQKVEDAWHIAMNYEKRDGQWWHNPGTEGDSVAGFAIQTDSWEYEIGLRGRKHTAAKTDLIQRLRGKNDADKWYEIEKGIVDGRLAYSTEWAFPLVTLFGLRVPREELEKIELKILELGIGLPVSGLFRARREMKKETAIQ